MSSVVNKLLNCISYFILKMKLLQIWCSRHCSVNSIITYKVKMQWTCDVQLRILVWQTDRFGTWFFFFFYYQNHTYTGWSTATGCEILWAGSKYFLRKEIMFNIWYNNNVQKRFVYLVMFIRKFCCKNEQNT